MHAASTMASGLPGGHCNFMCLWPPSFRATPQYTNPTGFPSSSSVGPATPVTATSTADRRSKSRWTQAFRFTWRERSKWKDLTKCLRANGGVAGCAQKFADAQAGMRTPPGSVRVGGEDRVPLIPFFVGVELLDRFGNYR